MGELIAKCVFGFRRGEVPALFAPANDRFNHAADQLSYGGFALWSIGLSVETLRSDNICRCLRPRFRYFHVVLPEDYLAFIIAYDCGTPLPLNFVIWGYFPVGEAALKFQAGSTPGNLICFGFSLQGHSHFRHLCLRAGSKAVLRWLGCGAGENSILLPINRVQGVVMSIEK